MNLGTLAEIALNPGELVVCGVSLRGCQRAVEVQTNEDEAWIFSPRGLRRFKISHVGQGFGVIAVPEIEQDMFAFEVRELQWLSIESAGSNSGAGSPVRSGMKP